MKTVSSVVWHLLVIQAATGINTLESTPDHINGQLLACVGDWISLTCARDFELGNGITFWTIESQVIPCTSIIRHFSPISIGMCNPFMFQDVTEITGAETITNLSSTAVATANVSMSDAVIQCSTSNFPSVSMPIGPSIRLCIPDQLAPPENIEVKLMENGTVQIMWDRPPSVCTERNISYDVNLIPLDGRSLDEGTGLPMTTTERDIVLYLTPGREYSALLTANNTDCFISSGTVRKDFTAMQNAATTAESPTSSATTEKATTQTAPTSGLAGSTITIIIVVVVILVIICIVLIIIAVWYFFWRPKALLKHANTTDAAMELPVNEKEKVDEADGNHELAPTGDEYAVIDKSNKRKPASENQALYQDPSSIQHETAPTGDVYAVTDRKKKKGPSEAELAQMYSVPDKTKGGGLNYASLAMPAGGGSEAKRPVPTEYATVIN